MVWPYVVGAILAAIGLFVLVQYNRMVSLRNRVAESWSNVDTELRRRFDLVPNLVAAVKGAAAHERGVLQEVTEARAAALAQPRSEAGQKRLVRALDRLLAVAESNPRLRANENFLRLQDELAVTEDRIQAARRFHNGNVRDYRDQTRQWPGSMVASAFRFPDLAFFEVDAVHVHAPRLDLRRA